MEPNDINIRDLALDFVLNTGHNVFLTGKAGTGKTTLLKEIVKTCKKNFVVVAPTGIASINAGGVTIHSFFHLPNASFLPVSIGRNNSFLSYQELIAQQRVKTSKRQLFSNLELLIIDEISMVRADTLDAIDQVLKKYRRSNLPFGGVQLLVMGDLYQLSPVVRNNDWHFLKPYYPTPFFFSANAWRNSESIRLELTKVYRQKDNTFVEILNNIRSGKVSEKDITTLNKRVTQDIGQDYIILSTHNNSVDLINKNRLNEISESMASLDAQIEGLYPENYYPVAQHLQIKVGAQVMFVKNNTEKKYYNGKIGTVTGIIDDKVIVKCPEDSIPTIVEREEWSNINYELEKSSNTIKENKLGTFKQFPLKLAWAITVHKSQGLTFDKVQLELDKTFAPGQLYVAFSRARSLEGISLLAPISKENVIVDQRVLEYQKSTSLPANIHEILEHAKARLEIKKIVQIFNFSSLEISLEEWKESLGIVTFKDKSKAFNLVNKLSSKTTELIKIGHLFITQINTIQQQSHHNDHMLQRLTKAIAYFSNLIHDDIIELVEAHRKEFMIKKNTKKYIGIVHDVLDDYWSKLEALYSIQFNGNLVFDRVKKHIRVKLFDQGSDKILSKTSTIDLTYQLFISGYDVEEIASKRDLTLGTVYAHLGKLMLQDKVDLSDILSQDAIATISDYITLNEIDSLTELKAHFQEKFSFEELRLVRNYIRKNKDSSD